MNALRPAALALAWVLSPAMAQQEAGYFELNLERQPIATALNALSKRTGMQIVYLADDSKRALLVGPISGRYTAEQALQELLVATGLTISVVNARTIAVSVDKSREPTQTSEQNPAKERLRLLATEHTLSAGARSARQSTGAETSDKPFEEIVVTARKRAESIQDVPISISAITAEAIEARGLFAAADYLRGVPGTNQVEGGPFGQSIVIRGIETSPVSQNFNSGTTTATYFGESPTTHSAGLAGNSNVDIKLVDIERVEVLRGPQGTAFGSASLGGAVRTIPVAPKSDRFETRVAVGYSVTAREGGDNYNVQAMANLPLVTDQLAVRAVGYKYSESGYYRNRPSSDPAFVAESVLPNGAQAFARDQDDVGAHEIVGGRIAASWQATSDLKLTLSHLRQSTEVDGIPLATSGLYQQALFQIAPEQAHRGRTGGFNDSALDLSNLLLEYRLPRADLVATYSYVESESRTAFSFGYLGLPQPQSGDAHSKHRENVAEVRLATRLEGAWNFLVGLYHEELRDGFGDDTFQTFYWLGTPASNIYARDGDALVGVASDSRGMKQTAAFAEVSWEFQPGWTLTGGARSYEYERQRHFEASGPYLVRGGGTSLWSNSVDASGTNLRGGLSYEASESALLYASWAEGFRLGTPTGPGLSASVCDTNNDGIVDGTHNTLESTGRLNSDEVDSYEIGAKLALLERRLTIDTAVFRMEWTGMPVTLSAPAAPIGCGLNYQANAGAAVSEGIELQIGYQISAPLRLDLGGSWIDATLTEDVPGVPGSKGNRLAGAPEINANLGLQYAFDIGGYEASVRADSIYVGSFFGNVRETPTTQAGDYFKLDAAARIEIGNLVLDLFVRNLTNEAAFSFRRNSSSTSELYGHRLRPRTIGLQLGYAF